MELNTIAIKKIRALRTEKQLSQKDMAEQLLIERSTYNKIETGKTELTLSMLEKIAKSLDTEVANLLNLQTTNISDSFNNTGTLSAQGINTTLNLHIPTEAIEEIKKLFTGK